MNIEILNETNIRICKRIELLFIYSVTSLVNIFGIHSIKYADLSIVDYYKI